MSAIPSERAQLSQLVRTPYIGVLTYPRISLPTARSRIRQLQRLKVEEIIFEGRTKIGRLGILGLGTVGVVVKARVGQQICALKIRRVDANRPDMEEEAVLTTLANRIGVGPEVRGHSKDMMLMELLPHDELSEWMKSLHGPGTRETARKMVHQILNQCRKLDIIGLDHGQLSNLRKHVVVVGGTPRILDFESASRTRRPKNLTTAAQYLLVGSKLSPLVRRTIGLGRTDGVVSLLRDYKDGLGDYSYAKLLEFLKVEAS